MEFPDQIFYVERLAPPGVQFLRSNLDSTTKLFKSIDPIQDAPRQLLLGGFGKRGSLGHREFKRLDHAAFIADVSGARVLPA
jgi:hypothetical protein